MRVHGPDGRMWEVKRRWMPKRPRLRKRIDTGDVINASNSSGWDIPDLFALEEVGVAGIVLGIVALVIFTVVLGTIVIPILAFTLELVLVAIVFAAGVIGRLLLGRPWRIEAVTTGPPRERREIHVAGLRASAQAVTDLAKDLEAGHQRATLVS